MRKNPICWLMALAAAVLLLAAGQYRTEGARGNEWSEPLEMMAHTLAQHGASLGRWVVYTREYAHDIQNDADFFKKWRSSNKHTAPFAGRSAKLAIGKK